MSETPQKTLEKWLAWDQGSPEKLSWQPATPKVREAIRAVLTELDEVREESAQRLQDSKDNNYSYRCTLESLKRAEAEAKLREQKSEAQRIALLKCAAAEARIRARWPHIEVPINAGAGKLGRRTVADPGSPTCLRCSIEDEIRGPEGGK